MFSIKMNSLFVVRTEFGINQRKKKQNKRMNETHLRPDANQINQMINSTNATSKIDDKKERSNAICGII